MSRDIKVEVSVNNSLYKRFARSNNLPRCMSEQNRKYALTINCS